MKHLFLAAALLLSLSFSLAGCVRQPAEQTLGGRVEMMQSRQFRLQVEGNIKPIVAVVVRENAQVAELHALMEEALRARGYELTENPSLAGYIVQLNAIHTGPMDAEAARRSVPQGYGYKIRGASTGDTFVLVTDVLVAARTLPKMKGKQSLVIASASSDTTVAGEELRVAALLPGAAQKEHITLLELEKAVARTVAEIFPILK